MKKMHRRAFRSRQQRVRRKRSAVFLLLVVGILGCAALIYFLILLSHNDAGEAVTDLTFSSFSYML